MFSNTIAQVNTSVQTPLNQVYEYALTLIDRQNGNTEQLTAAFSNLPTLLDWNNWLGDWTETGYSLASEPVLIHTI